MSQACQVGGQDIQKDQAQGILLLDQAERLERSKTTKD
jgi:hypothetical protein